MATSGLVVTRWAAEAPITRASYDSKGSVASALIVWSISKNEV